MTQEQQWAKELKQQKQHPTAPKSSQDKLIETELKHFKEKLKQHLNDQDRDGVKAMLKQLFELRAEQAAIQIGEHTENTEEEKQSVARFVKAYVKDCKQLINAVDKILV